MTNFLHSASGTLASGGFWSFTLKSTGSVSETTAETTWGGAVQAFFATTGVAALYRTDTILTATSTSTASAQWKQTTITRTTHTAAGSATTQQLPDFVSMIVTLRSANATKSAHGRWFLPPMTTASMGMSPGPRFLSGTMTTMASAVSTLFNSLATGGLSPVILTRKATVSGLPAFTTQAITHRDIPNIPGVQTRRADKILPARTTA